eukprot:238261_1
MSTDKNLYASLELLICGFLNQYQKQFKLSMPIANDIKDLICKFYQLVTVVIKNGSSSINAGFAGDHNDDKPFRSFPSIVGRPRHQGIMVGNAVKDTYIGTDALNKRGILSLKYPIEHGIITSWNDMENIWESSFKNELIISSKECNVLLTEKPHNPKINREKMTQIMFEKFGVNGLYIAIDAMLSLYATGRLTGIVMNCGDGISHTVPVYEGYVLQDAVYRMDTGGRDITMYLMRLLNDERGYSFTTSAEREIVKDIKEKLCYVAYDYEAEGKWKLRETSCDIFKNYELPDGQVITIGEERFRCMEILFKPWLRGFSACGIHKLLYDSVMKCEKDLRRDMYTNIVLSGGCCHAPGMDVRITTEMTSLAPASIRVKVSAPYGKNLSWIGGSMFASQEMFGDLMITVQEYNAIGPSIVHRKCF